MSAATRAAPRRPWQAVLLACLQCGGARRGALGQSLSDSCEVLLAFHDSQEQEVSQCGVCMELGRDFCISTNDCVERGVRSACAGPEDHITGDWTFATDPTDGGRPDHPGHSMLCPGYTSPAPSTTSAPTSTTSLNITNTTTPAVSMIPITLAPAEERTEAVCVDTFPQECSSLDKALELVMEEDGMLFVNSLGEWFVTRTMVALILAYIFGTCGGCVLWPYIHRNKVTLNVHKRVKKVAGAARRRTMALGSVGGDPTNGNKFKGRRGGRMSLHGMTTKNLREKAPCLMKVAQCFSHPMCVNILVLLAGLAVVALIAYALFGMIWETMDLMQGGGWGNLFSELGESFLAHLQDTGEAFVPMSDVIWRLVLMNPTKTELVINGFVGKVQASTLMLDLYEEAKMPAASRGCLQLQVNGHTMRGILGATALFARGMGGVTFLDVELIIDGLWNYEDFHLRIMAYIPFDMNELLGFRDPAMLRNLAFVKRSLIKGVQAWHEEDPPKMIAQIDYIVLEGPIANRLQLLWWFLILLWGIFAGSIGCCCCQAHWFRTNEYCVTMPVLPCEHWWCCGCHKRRAEADKPKLHVPPTPPPLPPESDRMSNVPSMIAQPSGMQAQWSGCAGPGSFYSTPSHMGQQPTMMPPHMGQQPTMTSHQPSMASHNPSGGVPLSYGPSPSGFGPSQSAFGPCQSGFSYGSPPGSYSAAALGRTVSSQSGFSSQPGFPCGRPPGSGTYGPAGAAPGRGPWPAPPLPPSSSAPSSQFSSGQTWHSGGPPHGQWSGGQPNLRPPGSGFLQAPGGQHGAWPTGPGPGHHSAQQSSQATLIGLPNPAGAGGLPPGQGDPTGGRREKRAVMFAEPTSIYGGEGSFCQSPSLSADSGGRLLARLPAPPAKAAAPRKSALRIPKLRGASLLGSPATGHAEPPCAAPTARE